MGFIEFLFSLPFATGVAIKEFGSLFIPTFVVGIFAYCNIAAGVLLGSAIGGAPGVIVGLLLSSTIMIFAAADASVFPRKTLTGILGLFGMFLGIIWTNESYTLSLQGLFPIDSAMEFVVITGGMELLILAIAGICGGIEREFVPTEWVEKLALFYRLLQKVQNSSVGFWDAGSTV